MRCQIKFVFIFIFTLVIPITAFAEPNAYLSNKEIFNWVTTHLGIEKNYPIPKIQLVSREKLQSVFRKTNNESFKRWAVEYGKKKADDLIEFYLKEVIGLFIPKTCSLFVGDFIEPCKRRSIIAHELTHYLQHVENGPIDPKTKGADQIYFYNELQAGNIEQKYMEIFCGRPGLN
jgi:hypothetical protein